MHLYACTSAPSSSLSANIHMKHGTTSGPTSVVSGSQEGFRPLVMCPVCMTGSIGFAPVTEQDRFVPEVQRFCDFLRRSAQRLDRSVEGVAGTHHRIGLVPVHEVV